MSHQPSTKPLLCRLRLHHRWVSRHNEDGEYYQQCKACGKDRDDLQTGMVGNVASLSVMPGW
jgi:hypothetical protein